MKAKQFLQSGSSCVVDNAMRNAVGEVLLAAMVLVFASSPGYGGEEEWLKAINGYRCMHDVPPVTSSQTLAGFAENTAKNCNHSHCAFPYPGANAETIMFPELSEQASVDAWYSEISYYDYSNPKLAYNTGHFITVVAKSMKEVGCSITSGNSQRACDYSSGGGYFDWTTPAGLNQDVLKPIRTKAQCANAKYICDPCGEGSNPKYWKWAAISPEHPQLRWDDERRSIWLKYTAPLDAGYYEFFYEQNGEPMSRASGFSLTRSVAEVELPREPIWAQDGLPSGKEIAVDFHRPGDPWVRSVLPTAAIHKSP